MVGTTLRFFSERVFGAWVEGVITRITPCSIHIRAHFCGKEWGEKVGRDTTFYYPQGHPLSGKPFKIELPDQGDPSS